MGYLKFCARLIVATLLVSAGCSSPTTPTPPPPPPPPIAAAPTLTCVEGIGRSTVNAAGMAVNFDNPSVTGGEGTVTVSCNPASGSNFPIGESLVTCNGSDTLNRSASCSFVVNVSRLPQLQRTRFLAFGDSITAGEVTVPVNPLWASPETSTKRVLVPLAAYPFVLGRTLQGRYSTQASTISVANYGLGGEKAINSRTRFLAALNIERPEVVLLLHGHNDIALGENGAASGAAFEIDIMAAEARNRGMRVYLATIAPPRPGTGKAINQFLVDDWNARIRNVASRQGATLVDVYGALITDVTRYIGVDGLHPTEAGYAKIADTFYQAIQSTLEVR